MKSEFTPSHYKKTMETAFEREKQAHEKFPHWIRRPKQVPCINCSEKKIAKCMETRDGVLMVGYRKFGGEKREVEYSRPLDGIGMSFDQIQETLSLPCYHPDYIKVLRRAKIPPSAVIEEIYLAIYAPECKQFVEYTNSGIGGGR